jgi:hypothetical protein
VRLSETVTIHSEIRTVSGPAALIDAAVHLIVNSSSVPSLRWSATNEDSLLPEALQIFVNWRMHTSRYNSPVDL